jgi:hypothetical protein
MRSHRIAPGAPAERYIDGPWRPTASDVVDLDDLDGVAAFEQGTHMLVLLFHLVHPSFRQREFVRWSLLCLLDKSMQHDQRLFAKAKHQPRNPLAG